MAKINDEIKNLAGVVKAMGEVADKQMALETSKDDKKKSGHTRMLSFDSTGEVRKAIVKSNEDSKMDVLTKINELELAKREQLGALSAASPELLAEFRALGDDVEKQNEFMRIKTETAEKMLAAQEERKTKIFSNMLGYMKDDGKTTREAFGLAFNDKFGMDFKEKLKKMFSSLGESGKAKGSSMGESAGRKIQAGLGGIWDAVKMAGAVVLGLQAFTKFIEGMNKSMEWFEGKAGWPEKISAGLANVIGSFMGLGEGELKELAESIHDKVMVITDIAIWLKDKVIDVIGGLFDNVKNMIEGGKALNEGNIVEGFQGLFSGLFGSIWTLLSSPLVWAAIGVKLLPQLLGIIGGFAGQALGKLAMFIGKTLLAVLGGPMLIGLVAVAGIAILIATYWDEIVAWVGDKLQAWFGVGDLDAEGNTKTLVSIMKDKLYALYDSVRNMIAGWFGVDVEAEDGEKKGLVTVFFEGYFGLWGKAIGLVTGWFDFAVEGGGNLWDSITDKLSEFKDNLKEQIMGWIPSIDDLKAGFSSAVEVGKETAENAWSSFKGMFGSSGADVEKNISIDEVAAFLSNSANKDLVMELLSRMSGVQATMASGGGATVIQNNNTSNGSMGIVGEMGTASGTSNRTVKKGFGNR